MLYIFTAYPKRYSYDVNVKGRSVNIRFRDRGSIYKTGIYTTTDSEIATAIRKSDVFGTVVHEEVDRIVVDYKPKVDYVAEYAEVTRTQDANKILVEKYGVDKSTLRSRQDALRKAEELNINFPNL
ncbi:MAG: hypothetical protein J6V13_03855 [Paludibacteraceae bacterium]|jgi:peptide methionine sulfoxide reductase MsrA|nr:hypothetical protein [Paludibacteraceae bacterium]